MTSSSDTFSHFAHPRHPWSVLALTPCCRVQMYSHTLIDTCLCPLNSDYKQLCLSVSLVIHIYTLSKEG